METFYKKLEYGTSHFTKDELFGYFYGCLESLNVKDKEKYPLEILLDVSDYKRPIKENTFVIDFRKMLVSSYQKHHNSTFDITKFDTIKAFNIEILEKLHEIIAYIGLREDLENGFMHLMEPEAFVCLTNELILNKDILLSHYCKTLSYIYTAKLLDECKVSKETQEAYNKNAKNKIFKEIQQNKNPLIMRAIAHDNTFSSIIWHKDAITEEKVENAFSQNFVKKYIQAIELFISRDYFVYGRSYAPFQIYEEREKELNNVSLDNKLVFGKRLTPQEKRVLENIDLSKIDLPDFSEKMWLDMTYEEQKMRQ